MIEKRGNTTVVKDRSPRGSLGSHPEFLHVSRCAAYNRFYTGGEIPLNGREPTASWNVAAVKEDSQ